MFYDVVYECTLCLCPCAILYFVHASSAPNMPKLKETPTPKEDFFCPKKMLAGGMCEMCRERFS